METQYTRLSMTPSGVPPVIYMSQNDIGRPIGFVCDADLSNYSVVLEATRTDGTPITVAVTVDGNICAFETTATMTNKADVYIAQIVVTNASGKHISSIPIKCVVILAAMNENSEGIEEDAPLYQQYTGTVQSLIADIRTQLNAEASARQAADNQLQSNINAEASTRATTDASLQSQINQLIAPSGEAPSAAEVENARVGVDGTVYPTLGDAIRTQNIQLKSALSESEETVTRKMMLVKSNNLATDSDFTSGYMAQDGRTHSATSMRYSKKIAVKHDNVVRVYYLSSGVWQRQSIRFVAAFNGNSAVSAKGAENVSSFTVPDEIDFVVITTYNGTYTMVTIDYEPTSYEEVFDPYYLATYDFIGDALPPIEIPQVTSAGHNMINLDDLVTGYYYGSGIGRKISFSNTASYRAAIIPVEPNTDYYVNANARFWAFTDDNDIVVSYGENAIIGIINSGSGTKFYFSQYKSIFEDWANYGFSYAVIMSKGNHGASTQVKKPEFISGITQNMMDAKYGCSLPKKSLYFTVGFEETWYTKNMIALEGNLVDYGIGGIATSVDGGKKITPVSDHSTGNGYWWSAYDERLAQIAQQSQLGIYPKADNLSNCTALVIGDSTVEQNRMTQGMLNLFGAREKTLTLLGTRGTAPNLHEGRAGWSAYDYCSRASKGSTPNLFFNPTTNKFDFSYYMSNQGYTAVDFVVIQLGINDLYNKSFMNSDNIISATVDYVSEIIASIKAWNADQKILLNLPTALNDDQKKQYGPLKLIRNMFVRYNEAIQLKIIKDNKIRCSYCHLILDPTTDISDDVHPTVAGYQKMAAEVVSQINCWQ